MRHHVAVKREGHPHTSIELVTAYGQNIHPWSKPGQMKDLTSEISLILDRTL
jgi:hypothetical protein